MSKAKKGAAEGPITLRWTLAELPGAQHRAGLAGLCLMVDHVRRMERPGQLLLHMEPHSASLTLDKAGLTSLLDEVYSASLEEVRRDKPFFKGDKSEKAPLRTVTEEVEEKGKKRIRTVWIYPRVVPGGGPLLGWEPDPPAEGEGGPNRLHGQVWITLWREMLWKTYRVKSTSRGCFEARAEGGSSGQEKKLWSALQQPAKSVDQTSSLLLGAQAHTSDLVPFADRPRFQLLLHFTTLVASVYVPCLQAWERKEGRLKEERDGYALAFPDIDDLVAYSRAHPRAQRARSGAVAGYLPRQALIDLPAEAGLDQLARLEEAISAEEGARGAGRAVRAYEVYHLRKREDEKDVRVLSVSRVEPTRLQQDRWAALRAHCRSPIVRHQRLRNLLGGQPWYAGFDRLIATTSVDLFIPRGGERRPWDAIHLQHDLRSAFQAETEPSPMNEQPDPIPGLVLRVVSTYIRHKLGLKYDLSWEQVREAGAEDPARRDFQEKKEKVARDAFLAIRSRSGQDFTDYFVSTLCSVPQRMKEEDYLTLSAALTSRPESVRTLSLLALSARS